MGGTKGSERPFGMIGVNSLQGSVSPTVKLTLPGPPILADLWLLTGTHGPEKRETAGLGWPVT